MKDCPDCGLLSFEEVAESGEWWWLCHVCGYEKESEQMKRFNINQGKGFTLIFDHCRLSTQFGYGNYGDNYSNYPKNLLPEIPSFTDSDEAEIAILPLEKGDVSGWLTSQMIRETSFSGDHYEDDVMGYVSFKDWLLVLDWCRRYKPLTLEERNK